MSRADFAANLLTSALDRANTLGARSKPAKVKGHTYGSYSSTCAFPPAHNTSTFASEPDRKYPRGLCKPQLEPPPTGAALAQLPPGRTVPLVPSLLVPCCAHSGTTFLWRCMRYAFHPERVCGATGSKVGEPALAWTSNEWSAGHCGARKYFLPGLAGNIQGHWDYRKEWFFYGGGAAAFAKGWADYTGIELPLCWWESAFLNDLRTRPMMDTISAALASERVTVLFVEHDMEVVTRYADRVLAFYSGDIIADDTPERVLADPKVQEFVTGTAR